MFLLSLTQWQKLVFWGSSAWRSHCYNGFISTIFLCEKYAWVRLSPRHLYFFNVSKPVSRLPKIRGNNQTLAVLAFLGFIVDL